MIARAQTPQEWQALSGFLQHYAGVQASTDLQCVGWVSDKTLVMVVGLNGFLGSVAQIHWAMLPDWHFVPKAMLREVFDTAFNKLKREMLLGVVNSKNEKAMRVDLHLGFRELYRLHGMHDDGGDVVLLGMKKAECRYLNAPTEAIEVAVAGSA